MANAADYIENVRKYRPRASEETVQKIVNHLGIALQSRDASLVSCSDPEELKKVRTSWCHKKLKCMQMDDDELDKHINEVCVEMAGEKGNKHRVTFYYLLADRLDKLVDL